ncbi:hypothetical protein MTBPR1_60109 [Candidatus Terasakiella magnetica]|uniref:Uncharacterized protein n=1 Tax=Candidatus Terasakiella magnetica TaxID=1867952 RepID=A0A1C3RK00_9PROT|nr:hypothetical protein [Candidatus Terasakiella magnetica]SCA57596.1 hypothetical protein MTBPR1_60109 [Candidatus Terasakiella magnetica]
MTKTNDKQLNNWLDHYKVDVSHNRMSRLEEEIFAKINMAQAPMFAPMGMRESLYTLGGVGLVSSLVLVLSQWLQASSEDVVLATLYSYGGF